MQFPEQKTFDFFESFRIVCAKSGKLRDWEAQGLDLPKIEDTG